MGNLGRMNEYPIHMDVRTLYARCKFREKCRRALAVGVSWFHWGAIAPRTLHPSSGPNGPGAQGFQVLALFQGPQVPRSWSRFTGHGPLFFPDLWVQKSSFETQHGLLGTDFKSKRTSRYVLNHSGVFLTCFRP